MRKLLSMLIVFALVATQINTVAFGAYGGGTSTVSFGGGGGSYTAAPTSFLVKDTCPNGDYSSSSYDGSCGTAPVVAPSIISQVVNVVAPLFDKLLETGPKGTGIGYGTGKTPVPACVPVKLNDITASSNSTSINVLVDRCIVKGNLVSFLPKSRVTSAEFTKVVMKSLGISANYSSSFQSAKDLGIVSANIKPSAQLTRTQAYSILKAALKVAKKQSQIKIQANARGYITREEMAQLVVSAIGSKNIATMISHE